jgi:glycosyltransferase involved in cell wall biosynthesis
VVLLSHPAVNAYTRNISLALNEQNLLDEFCTTLGWGDGGLWMRRVPRGWRKEWSRRQVDAAVARKVVRHGVREVGRLLASHLYLNGLSRHESGPFSVDAVYRDLDRFVAKRVASRQNLTAVYCGEDGALETFRAARERGLKCIYDLPIGYWAAARRLFDEEKEIMPEFAPTLQGREESSEKLERKREEAELADRIVVCSPFVAATLKESGFADSKISVVPYGGPAPIARIPCEPDLCKRPLRLLFAGSIGQRKGIGYLMQAMQKLKGLPVELTLMGSFVGDRSVFSPYEHLFRYEPPRAHSAVLELMQQHDVLVLPSLFEGFALVILEAMSRGLVVIVTPNTGAGEIVRDGTDGFIVPIRSSEVLEEKIVWMVHHRHETKEMGLHAARRAEEFSWERFRVGIRKAVLKFDNGSIPD